MGIEIERRFIVKGKEWEAFAKQPKNLLQGYLSTNFEEWVIRMRIINNKESEITLKAKAGAIKNHEFEYPIPLKDSVSIWKLISKKLYKKRYILNYAPGEWIVDCFQGENHPLVIAEVELKSEEQFIKIPTWCRQEITGIKQLSNASLASYPISNWTTEELQNFNLP